MLLRDKIRVIVAGSTGMLGKDIVSIFSNDKNYELFGISRHDCMNKVINYKHYICDMTNFHELRRILNEIDPQIIIDSVANTDVEQCEMNRQYTYLLHVGSAEILSLYKSDRTKIIYISTDAVFDGMKGNYSEEDEVNPINYYSETKLTGEKRTMEINGDALILRTNLYGYHVPMKNSFVEWAIKNWKSEKSINGYSDVYFNPLYSSQLAKIIYVIVKEKNINGILNVGCKQSISKYRFLAILADQIGIPNDFIKSISIDDVGYFAKRPKNTTLNLSKYQSLFSDTPDIYQGINELTEDLEKEGWL